MRTHIKIILTVCLIAFFSAAYFLFDITRPPGDIYIILTVAGFSGGVIAGLCFAGSVDCKPCSERWPATGDSDFDYIGKPVKKPARRRDNGSSYL